MNRVLSNLEETITALQQLAAEAEGLRRRTLLGQVYKLQKAWAFLQEVGDDGPTEVRRREVD